MKNQKSLLQRVQSCISKRRDLIHAKRLGVTVAFATACRARNNAMLSLQAAGAGYTDRHGK